MTLTDKNRTLEPTIVIRRDSEAFKTIATSLASYIRDDNELYAAFLDHCKSKGHEPRTFLQSYAEHCLAMSAANTSAEEDANGNRIIYGDFHCDIGMFAARVNLLGLPNVKKALVAAVSDAVTVRPYAYVEDGRLNCNVERVGTPDEVRANNRKVRDTLRLYGFGEIETIDWSTYDEGNGLVSVPTISSRTLP